MFDSDRTHPLQRGAGHRVLQGEGRERVLTLRGDGQTGSGNIMALQAAQDTGR